MLINAVTLPRPVEAMAPVVIEALERLNGEFGICRATVANLPLARRFRQALPDWSLTASVLMDISNPYQAQLVNGICDTLVPSSRVVRDMPALKAIRAAYRGRLRLMVNESCLPGCPFRTQHFHRDGQRHAGAEIALCRIALRGSVAALTGAWVLPQHLHFYAGIYDEMKLAGRMTLHSPATFRRVLESYIQRRALQPHEIGGGPAAVLVPIDISARFFAYTLGCGRRCHECKRCPEYYEAATGTCHCSTAALTASGNDRCGGGGRAVAHRVPFLALSQVGEYSQQAIFLAQKGQLAEAAIAFQQVLELKPDFAEGHTNLGNVFSFRASTTRRRPVTSRRCASSPIMPTPTRTWPMSCASRAGWRKRWPTAAQPCSSTPILWKLTTTWLMPSRTRATWRQRWRDYQEALRLDPNHAEAHNNLGVVLKEQGQPAAAVAHYQEALRLKPDYLQAAQQHGQCSHRHGHRPTLKKGRGASRDASVE